MDEKPESWFDRQWRLYGGTWTVTWADGSETRGRKEPSKPKLRVIEGGSAKSSIAAD